VLGVELILEEVICLGVFIGDDSLFVVVIELTGMIAQFTKLLVANKKLEMVAESNKMDHSE